MAIKVRSITLNGKSGVVAPMMELDELVSHSTLYPSGALFMTSSTPGMVAPPGLLTIRTGTFHFFSSARPSIRALRSVDPPATQGTMISTGLVGKSAAPAVAANAARTVVKQDSASIRNFFIMFISSLKNHL